MSELKPSQMLRKAWALIDAPEKWTKNSLAKDDNSIPCSPLSESAKCFCSLGAIDRSCGDIFEDYHYLLRQMNNNIIHYNDHHTWEEVKAAWMKAIALAEEDEAKNG